MEKEIKYIEIKKNKLFIRTIYILAILIVLISIFYFFIDTNIKEEFSNPELVYQSEFKKTELRTIKELNLLSQEMEIPYSVSYNSKKTFSIRILTKDVDIISKDVKNTLVMLYVFRIKIGVKGIKIYKTNVAEYLCESSKHQVNSFEILKDSIIKEEGNWNKTITKKIEDKLRKETIERMNLDSLYKISEIKLNQIITNLIDSITNDDQTGKHITFKKTK